MTLTEEYRKEGHGYTHMIAAAEDGTILARGSWWAHTGSGYVYPAIGRKTAHYRLDLNDLRTLVKQEASRAQA